MFFVGAAMRSCEVFALLILILTQPAFSQENPSQEKPWDPPNRSSVSFTNSAVVKIYKNRTGDTVLGVIRSPNEIKTRFLMKQRMETRSRMVKDPDTGESREETYIVQVPYSEQIEYVEKRPARIEIPLESSKIWKTRGVALSSNEAAEFLSAPKRCFFIDNPYSFYAKKNTNPLNEFHAKMLDKDIVVVWYDRKKAQPAEAAKQ